MRPGSSPGAAGAVSALTSSTPAPLRARQMGGAAGPRTGHQRAPRTVSASPGVSTAHDSRSCPPSRPVAPSSSAVTSTAATPASASIRCTTHAAIATVRPVRASPHGADCTRAPPTSCPCPTSISSLPCRTRSPRSPQPTAPSCSTSCSAPPSRPCAPSPPISCPY